MFGNVLLQLGVALIGVLLLFEVIKALITGSTSGYYRAHSYDRSEDSGKYYTWVVWRAVLGGLAIAAVFL